MTYTGEMVLPRNAVMMQEEEMRYVEGGLTRKYTRNQSYNNYVLMAATGYTAGLITICAGVLSKIAGVALGAAGLSSGLWYKYQNNFKKAGTGRRNGCKVTFTTITNWKFTYYYK